MSGKEEQRVAKVAELVGGEMEASGAETWTAVYKVFWFEDLEEWCVCPTYMGHEWGGDHEITAVFRTIELAFAFARILNKCGISWLTDNRFSVEVDLAKGVLLA